MSSMQGFSMNSLAFGSDLEQSVLINLPMYAQMSNSKVSDLPFSRLAIKLKEPRNKNHIKRLKFAL
jgi:hypothetical protein